MSFRSAPARFSNGRIVVVPVYADAAANVTLPITFQINGPYSVEGANQTEVILDRIAFDLTIIGAKLLIKTAGSGGTTEVDIQYSTNGGSSWSSIFLIKPSVLASVGNYAESSNASILENGVVLSAGALLRLNITQVQSGNPDGFVLQLFYKV